MTQLQVQIELQMATLQQHNNELKYAKFVMKIANVGNEIE